MGIMVKDQEGLNRDTKNLLVSYKKKGQKHSAMATKSRSKFDKLMPRLG